ncbi:MAG: DUF805 domain-containing protein [Pseudomonadota bacterium]
MGSVFNYLFNPNGRISRSSYWLQFILPYIGISVAASVIDMIITPDLAAAGGGIVGTIVALFYFWPSIAIPVKRFHDRGMTGWWVLFFALMLIAAIAVAAIGFAALGGLDENPAGIAVGAVGIIAALVVGIWQLVILGFLPGQKMPNQYGPDPLNPNAGTAETFA